MPLQRGYSQTTFRENVREMIGARHSRGVALAASFRQARRSARRAGKRPAWLRRSEARYFQGSPRKRKLRLLTHRQTR